MKLFVVLTRGRTGSTPIVEDLDQHPKAVCHQELFRREPVVSFRDRAPSYEAAVAKAGRALSVDEYLGQTTALAPPEVEVVGFKLLNNQMEERKSIGLSHYIRDSAVPVIVLIRRPARAALSAAIASERSAFSWPAGQDERYKRAVRVDPAWVVDEAKYYADWNSHWSALLDPRNRRIECSYESYLADRLGTINVLFEFLDLEPLTELPPNPYARNTSDDVWDDVINGDEMKSELIANGLEL